MSLATTYCRADVGVDAPLVSIETHLANGLPAFNIVGLAEKSVQESKERVRSALVNCGFEFPAKRITIALAPAELPKTGSRYDLAIAIGILAASQQLPKDCIKDYEFAAELSLSGKLRTTPGTLPLALASRNANHKLLLAMDNLEEALLIEDIEVFGSKHLLEAVAHLNGQSVIENLYNEPPETQISHTPDMREVKGQAFAKRALEICAAGRHNLLMVGPPGSGKSMLASRLPGILPDLTEQEAMEAAAIHSIAGLSLNKANWRQRRLRQPHHTTSGAALVGGGRNPKPGEISLAHRNVLFLDEILEFNPKVLEVLREPLETGQISISRANGKIDFPAQFQLVAAMTLGNGSLPHMNHSCNAKAVITPN